MRTPNELEELRDVLLMLVYLDEWRAYRPLFTLEKFGAALAAHRRLSSVLEWIRREGAACSNWDRVPGRRC
jgi:hypothetical protein